jgi:hypothetical protein
LASKAAAKKRSRVRVGGGLGEEKRESGWGGRVGKVGEEMVGEGKTRK